jgi:hypothetical protein
MSYLTEEARQKVFNTIGGNEEVEATPEAPEEQAVEAESAPQEEANASDSEESEEEDHPHSIPYNRFRTVNEERKEFRNLAEEQTARIEELEEKLERMMAGTATQREERDVVDAFNAADEDIDWEGFRNNVVHEMEELRISNAQAELERDISYALEDYPDVPNDGTVDVLDFAQQYNEFITEIREGAVADYVKKNGSSTRARPRVASAGSTQSESTSAPKTFEDAKNALLKQLKGTV